MNPLNLFNTLGFIFGPAVFLAGIVALVMCARTDSPRSVRRVLVFSCMPFALGVLAALVGLAIVLQVEPDRGIPWYNLGKTCLAGLVVTLPPLLWALRIRSRGGRRPAVVDIDG